MSNKGFNKRAIRAMLADESDRGRQDKRSIRSQANKARRVRDMSPRDMSRANAFADSGAL